MALLPTAIKPNILIVEDSPTLALTYREYLRILDVPIEIAETGADALKLIAEKSPTVVLLDLKLPDMEGITILKQLKAAKRDTRVIVVTAHGSVAVAVEAMREGADDFLLKPFTADRITITVKNALEMHRLANLVQQFEGRNSRKFDKFIGESQAMQAVYRMIEDCAPSKASVFIMGESGTGKELCAEAIHQMSPRNSKKFVALNCAAIPENLIESEIFGHKKGAFTGAVADRDGAAVSAHGGTLFLDEICEMPLDLQAKLLRFVQTGEVVPVGSNIAVPVNVRFVCATNRIPWEEVASGRFREDLYYRLHVIPIHLPPLRERGKDVVTLAKHLLAGFSKEEGKTFTIIEPAAEARLLAHSWPGNVRELGNVIQSAVVLNDGPRLSAAMLERLMGQSPATIQRQAQKAPSLYPPPISKTQPDTIEPFAVQERRIIEHTIALCNGKVRMAAVKLGLNPSTLYRKIKEWA
ncbi:sigma-54-dependent transcriptional regulator [Kordiimonas pumila]|uniref:Sigma-54-dependent transcriptional regulator n=1 Tax=Kordiimonas pumila TaxID=2161677 RepID=A0ABV7D9Y3_9PROT|nr:sigma-54 dependent transcriptional regulator [Kordiimonas pumila]